MAGSLSHITDESGAMTLDLVETGGDRLEALEECFDLISVLCKGNKATLDAACRKLNFPIPKALPIAGRRAYTKLAPPAWTWE